MYLIDNIDIENVSFDEYAKAIYNGNDYDTDRKLLKRFITGIKRYKVSYDTERKRLVNDIKILSNSYDSYYLFKLLSVHLKDYRQGLYCIYHCAGLLPPLLELNNMVYNTADLFKKGKCKPC